MPNTEDDSDVASAVSAALRVELSDCTEATTDAESCDTRLDVVLMEPVRVLTDDTTDVDSCETSVLVATCAAVMLLSDTAIDAASWATAELEEMLRIVMALDRAAVVCVVAAVFTADMFAEILVTEDCSATNAELVEACNDDVAIDAAVAVDVMDVMEALSVEMSADCDASIVDETVAEDFREAISEAC